MCIKLLNGANYFPTDVAPATIKAKANWPVSELWVTHCGNGRQRGCDQNNKAASQ